MSHVAIESIRSLVSKRYGLYIREIDLPDIQQKLLHRMAANNLNGLEEYHALLEDVTGEGEWDDLIPLLTTGESYFFRDKGQIELLKQHILPELINRALQDCDFARGDNPSLKIWSAGCSRGEEAYTLAILLTQLIEDIAKWNISILGTDLNPEAIEKSKQGIYRAWSFRQVDPQYIRDYFVPVESEWQVKSNIKKLVRFRVGNLLEEKPSSPFADTRDIDLIICRNVFIYFQSDTICEILRLFHNSLKTGGYLISGHSELYKQNMSGFDTLSFSQSAAYRKCLGGKSKTIIHEDRIGVEAGVENDSGFYDSFRERLFEKKGIENDLNSAQSILSSLVDSASMKTSSVPIEVESSKQHIWDSSQSSLATIREAEISYASKDYERAIQLAVEALESEPELIEALFLAAKAYSDRNQLDVALDYALRASECAPNSCEVLYLVACIYEALGDIQTAKKILKRILYLDRNAYSAYLILGELYRKEGNHQRCQKMYLAAIELLEKLPKGQLVVYQESMILVEELISHVQKSLRLRNV